MSLVGRSGLVSLLVDLVLGGEHAALYGPVGVGKSALLRAVERDLKARGVRVGFASTTASLSDVTDAFSRAHPDVDVAVSARMRRSRLRNAADGEASVLLLDDVRGAGTMLKGLLRSIRGSRTGVLLAVDVNDPRDHVRLREWSLARREIAIPRLQANSVRVVMKRALNDAQLPHPISDEDERALVHAAEGLPGRATEFARRLADDRSWHDERVRVGWLRSEIAIAELERYRADLGGLDG